jgi:hypothetical protein
MTSALPLKINESNVISQEGQSSQGKIGTNQKIDSKSTSNGLKSSTESRGMEPSDLDATKSFDNEASPTAAVSQEYSSYLHYSNPTPTQQPIPGYYVYPPQTHLIPDPDSPGGNRLIGAYDVGSFFQPHSGAAFHAPSTLLRVGRPSTTPVSPSKGSSSVAAVATPTSPLFTRASSGMVRSDGMTTVHPSAPALPYMTSPQLYQMYPATGIASNSSDEGTWTGQTTSDAR